MIRFRDGDLFRDESEALVNAVNCVGVMGGGIALQFRNLFPDNFKAYAKARADEQVRPGKLFVFETGRANPRYVINFPTKRHWREKSRLADIESGLKALAEFIIRGGITSIALPALGSGLGGLLWTDVKERIEIALGIFSGVRITVYEPRHAPAGNWQDSKVEEANLDLPR